jgi:predicted transglutaminase-like cysteine proteinase
MTARLREHGMGLLLAGGLLPLAALPTLADDGAAPWIDLPVVRIVPRYPPYADFCARLPGACRLEGPARIPHSAALGQQLREVSASVNRAVRFALDIDMHGVEDYWSLPESGYGDCEDLALAKRQRLVKAGYPGAALRLAFVSHRRDLCSHCVLTIDTTRGTFVLDSRTDAIRPWSATPYNFEARERPDGNWDRYDQAQWRYDD